MSTHDKNRKIIPKTDRNAVNEDIARHLEDIALLTNDLNRALSAALSNISLTKRLLRYVQAPKNHEQELEQNLAAHQLNSSALIASGIAQYFNNILTVILGNISLAKLDIKSENNLLNRLLKAERACVHGKNLTDKLLNFSKNCDSVVKKVNILELVRDSSMIATAGSNVKCQLEASKTLWPVACNQEQIRHTIISMIIIARRAMPKGGTVQIGIENIKSEDAYRLSFKRKRHVKISISFPNKSASNADLLRTSSHFKKNDPLEALSLILSYLIMKVHQGYIRTELDKNIDIRMDVYLPVKPRG